MYARALCSPMLTADTDGVITAANTSAIATFGYPLVCLREAPLCGALCGGEGYCILCHLL